MAIVPPPEGDLKVLKKEPPEEADAPQQVSSNIRRIPSSMWKPVEEDVIAFLEEELAAAYSERWDFMWKLSRWVYVYEAPMSEHPKTFPFWGASNLTLPIVKKAVNTLVAQLIQATMTARPYWVLQDLAEEWEPFVDEIETFMDIAGDRDLKLHKNAIPWIIGMAKKGTGILEVAHEVDERENYHITADGKRVYPKEIVLHDGPITYPVRLEDFLIRFGETDIQRARWCGKILRMNRREIEEKERQGKFFDVERIFPPEPEEPDETTKVSEEIESTVPVTRQQYEIHEIWLSWPFRDGKYSEIVVYYHMGTRTVIGHKFHPYWHGKRPFVKIGYFPVDGRFYDQGLCEMLEQVQEAVSARFNMRSDNITLASIKMFLKRKGVRGLQPGDPLYVTKAIEVMDVWNDIREFSMGEVYPSTFQEEAILNQYADDLAGLNEGTVGSAMPVTRTTASAQLALLQEQAKRIDLTVRSVRGGQNEVGMQAMELYQQFGTNGKGLAWMGERGRIIEAIFRLPKRVIELGMAIKAQVPTSLQNRQVKRENSLAMFNLLVQLYKEMLPLAQALAPEHLPHVVSAMVSAAQKVVGDVLETFDVSDPEEALAGLTVLERVLPRAENLGGLEAFARGVESAEIIDKLSGLEGILREADAARYRDGGVSLPRRNTNGVPQAAGRVADVPQDLFFGGEPG